MHLYTFITEYKGGTYIIQVKARHIEEAALKWADEILSGNIPGRHEKGDISTRF